MFLLPRPRRELASALAPTKRRVSLREMASPRSRRRDQPRASSERRRHHAAESGSETWFSPFYILALSSKSRPVLF